MKTEKQRWQVYPDKKPDAVMFEGGSRSACVRYLRENRLAHDYRRGIVRIGKLLWEALA